jgi:hypothetical protein
MEDSRRASTESVQSDPSVALLQVTFLAAYISSAAIACVSYHQLCLVSLILHTRVNAYVLYEDVTKAHAHLKITCLNEREKQDPQLVNRMPWNCPQ